MPKRGVGANVAHEVRRVEEMTSIAGSAEARKLLEEIKRHADPLLEVSRCLPHEEGTS